MKSHQKTKLFILLRVVLFVFVFFFLFITFSKLFRPITNAHSNIVGFYKEKANSLDLICIGGSSTYVYWDPIQAYQEFGIASYNFAGDTMPPSLMKYMIIEALKTQKNAAFMIDLRAFVRREIVLYELNNIRGYSDFFAYSRNRYNLIQNVTKLEVPGFDEGNMLEMNIDFIRYHSTWKTITRPQYSLTFKGANPLKGFNFVPLPVESFEPPKLDGIEGKLSLSEDNDAILTDLLDFCRRENLKVVFAITPYYLGSADKERFNYISSCVSDYGFPVMDANDFYEEMDLDFSTDFYNANHVNIFGAEKFTRFVAPYFVDALELPDRRNDTKYTSWNALIPKWKADKDFTQAKILELSEAKEAE
ncbi:MAG: hypothetical protein LBM69_10440 [Lachnospiraceae bacterium]|jgi:hypothetical protein|nr:hypothetical protein [Lachnospiraceae bacterium]